MNVGRESRRKDELGGGQGAGLGRGGADGDQGGPVPVVDRRALEKSMIDVYRLLAKRTLRTLTKPTRSLPT